MPKTGQFVFLTLLIFCTNLSAGTPPSLGLRFQQPYPGSNLIHGGIDLDVPYGTPVRAISDGEVTIVSTNPRELFVIINHNDGRNVWYYHLGKIVVSEKEVVQRGQIIAYTGRTGYSSPARNQLVQYPHLHLEVFQHGVRIDPESLGMTCPIQESKWWWPVGCDEPVKK